MAEGRLTAEEHAERVDAVYRAKTVGELEPLVRDLPTPGGATRPSSATTTRARGRGCLPGSWPGPAVSARTEHATPRG
ncbi:DUF1707 SHOCT-like domain-containing protein [Streptomyces sp. 900116325]